MKIEPEAAWEAPIGLSQRQIEELENKVAERCVDILIDAGVFLGAAVYEPSA